MIKHPPDGIDTDGVTECKEHVVGTHAGRNWAVDTLQPHALFWQQMPHKKFAAAGSN